jgi:hypothetical protein
MASDDVRPQGHPHVLVKQEVPAQGLNIELKSIK